MIVFLTISLISAAIPSFGVFNEVMVLFSYVICLKSDSVGDNDLPVGTGFGWLNIIMFYVESFMCIHTRTHTHNWTSR